MKNVKLVVLATMTMLFLGMGNVSAQENQSKTVVIRVIESMFRGKSSIVTIDPEGKTNITELKNGLDEFSENTVLIQKELEKWKKEGFKIDGVSNSGWGDVMMVTTIILSKKE